MEAALVGADGPDPMQWTSERRHRMERAQRYKNSTERAFYKAWSVLQGLRKDIMRLEDQKAKLKLQVEILKSKNAGEEAEQQREKERQEERVEPPKVIVIYRDGPEGKVIRDERVGGKVVKREEVFVE